jgi:hypothetical protein
MFEPATAWRAFVADDEAGVPRSDSQVGNRVVPAELDRDAPAARVVVLLTATDDPAEPLWRGLSRLVWAAWRAPAVGVGRGRRPLRHPPAVAVTANGLRSYGVLAQSAVHAAEVADAFGVHWLWWRRDEPELLLIRAGRVLATLSGREVADAPAPAEGEALWDDEQFVGGVPLGPTRFVVRDAVAEVRSAIAMERRLSGD